MEAAPTRWHESGALDTGTTLGGLVSDPVTPIANRRNCIVAQAS